MREGILFLAFGLLFTACSRGGDLKQIQQQRSGDYAVSLLNETGVIQRSDHVTIEIRNANTNDLVDVNDLQVQSSMVMAGMGPMFATLKPPEHSSTGRYTVDADFGMTGRWSFVVTFDGNQRVQFSLNAQ